MNITFFIGNGFDINLGLKTRYQDFYPYFLQNAREENMIRDWISEHEHLWADLEERLGQELIHVADKDLPNLYRDKEELDLLLIEYLEQEQQKYNLDNSEMVKKEFSRSLLNFTDELPAKDELSIKSTLESCKDDEYVYEFINFNYTNILDKIVALFKDGERTIAQHRSNGGNIRHNTIGAVLHIHGTTDGEPILGVNDEAQINNDSLRKNGLFLDTFIKKNMNSELGQRKTENAKKIIKESRIICVFGMSIGNTDKIWWEEIISWLVMSSSNKLVIFWREDAERLRKRLPSTVVRLNEEVRRRVFDKGKGELEEAVYQKIKERIIILYNSNVFSFPRVGGK